MCRRRIALICRKRLTCPRKLVSPSTRGSQHGCREDAIASLAGRSSMPGAENECTAAPRISKSVAERPLLAQSGRSTQGPELAERRMSALECGGGRADVPPATSVYIRFRPIADVSPPISRESAMRHLLPFVHDRSASQSRRWRDHLTRHPHLRDDDRSTASP